MKHNQSNPSAPEFYVTPLVEVVAVSVEEGYATSVPGFDDEDGWDWPEE